MRAPSYVTGAWGSGTPPVPKISSSLANALILQPGIRQTRDETWQVDELSVPYKIARSYIATFNFPERFTPHPTIPTMAFERADITHGQIMADVTYIYRGIIDGVIPGTGTRPAIPPDDSTQLQTLQISDPNSSAVADVAFYCPQTVWRFVTLGYPASTPAGTNVINDPHSQRIPVPVRYVIRTDPGAAPSDLTGIYQMDEVALKSDEWGLYWKNELTVQYRYANPFTA